MNNQGLKKRVDREKTIDYAFIEVLQQRKNNRSPSLSGYILETVLAQYALRSTYSMLFAVQLYVISYWGFPYQYPSLTKSKLGILKKPF